MNLKKHTSMVYLASISRLSPSMRTNCSVVIEAMVYPLMCGWMKEASQPIIVVESDWTAQCTSHLEHHYYVIYGNTLGLL